MIWQEVIRKKSVSNFTEEVKKGLENLQSTLEAKFEDMYSAPQEETENHFFQHSVHSFCDGTW